MISTISYSQSINNGLLLHYPLDNSAIDLSGNMQDGTVRATSIADRFGNPNSAFAFNGVDDYIDFPNSSKLKPDLPVSFSFWIKYNSADVKDRTVFNTSLEENVNSGVFFTSQSSTGNYAVGFGDGSPAYSSSTRRSYVSNTAIDTSAWQHIVIVVSSATDMKIYVNCEEPGGTYSGSGGALSYSSASGSLGRHDQNTGTVPSFYLKGYLDDFRYWDRELTISEVGTLCNNLILPLNQLEKKSHEISVYPNPVQNTLNLKIEEYEAMKVKYITLTNILGKVVYESAYQPNLKLGHLKKGTYFLQVLNKNKELIDVVKVIKE